MNPSTERAIVLSSPSRPSDWQESKRIAPSPERWVLVRPSPLITRISPASESRAEIGAQLARVLANYPFSLPRNGFADAIERSGSLLELQPGWDGEGALSVSGDALRSAHEFLKALGRALADCLSQAPAMPQPRITPCIDGSVDILWRSDKFRFLANMQGSGDSDFYGEADGLSSRASYARWQDGARLAQEFFRAVLL